MYVMLLNKRQILSLIYTEQRFALNTCFESNKKRCYGVQIKFHKEAAAFYNTNRNLLFASKSKLLLQRYDA